MRKLVSLLTAGLIFSASAAANADEPSQPAPEAALSLFELPAAEDLMAMKTLGGRLFWGDVAHFRSWRIQQNIFTGHHRLLDPTDWCYTSGTLEQCSTALEEIKKKKNLPPLSGKAVIFLHGMGRSSKSWPKLAQRLEADGYIIVGFDYPSTRCSISDSAAYLAKVIDSLEGVEQIDLVAHSMGGLVVRAYLAAHEDPRLHRLVMLGVPNRGAEMADWLASWPVFQLVCGPGGCQLVSNPAGFIANLPTPEFEFAVIAGGRGTPDGFNPLIPGDDDGTVTIHSTRLPGATDFLQVDGAMHSFIMFDARVVDATARFLQIGQLRDGEDPHPIPKEPVEAEIPETVPQISSAS